MALYRLFFLNHEHETTGAAWIECDTDEQAIAEARNRASSRRVVVWHDDRLLGVFKAPGD